MSEIESLLPCPFCGAGVTHIVENGKVWTGWKYNEPLSISIMHYCPAIEGQPSRKIERVGRDMDSAIKAWNMRAIIYSEPKPDTDLPEILKPQAPQ